MLCGCAQTGEPGSRHSAGSWLRARALDLVDVASARVAVGPALLVHARITRFVQVGVGHVGRLEGVKAGFRLPVHFLGWTSAREGGLWTERRAEFGLGPAYVCEAEVHSLFGNVSRGPPETRGPWDIGAALHLALAGLEVDVRPLEALDFLAGLVGADPSGDDPGGSASAPESGEEG